MTPPGMFPPLSTHERVGSIEEQLDRVEIQNKHVLERLSQIEIRLDNIGKHIFKVNE